MLSIPRCRLFALVAMLALGIAPAAAANSHSHAHKPSAGGSIVVHGHWTIVVRNHGGAIVTRRTFENSYLPGGAVLPSVLGRTNSVGLWGVDLSGNACGRSSACLIVENGFSNTTEPMSSNLTVATGAGGGALVLSGSIVAPSSGQITDVLSYVGLCSPTVPPTIPCVGGYLTPFTAKQLGTPVNVTAGQQIAVTVTFTFS